MSFVRIIDGVSHKDNRGVLSKFISFQETLGGIPFPVAEVFRSKTLQGFVRGMHFQTGSAANNRLIHILDGHIYTNFVDLRPGSPSFGQVFGIETSSGMDRTFVVPAGIAHGYYAISNCDVLYFSDQPYDFDLDAGVSPYSGGISWPQKPIGLSDRDAALPTLDQYIRECAEKST